MKALEDLKEMLEDELKKIVKKGDINPTELESVYRVIRIMKDMDEIKQSEESQGQGGYSMRGGYSQRGNSYGNYSQYMPMGYPGPTWSNDYSREWSNDGNSNDYSNEYSRAGRRGRDGDGDGQYSEEGSSYARGRGRNARRDSRGRYSNEGNYSRDNYSNEGYSRHDSKEHMIEKLEMMMDEASTEQERKAIQKCMEQLGG